MIPAITDEHITKFVKDWFKKLDDHAPVDECYRMLARDGLEMHFPECTIWDFSTFADWYGRVIRLFFDEKHIIKSFPPKIDGDRAEISLEVAWQAIWVALILRVGALLFRKTVLKSGPRVPWWRFGRA